MIDGVRAADRSWVGVCLATVKGMSFLRILTVEGQTAVNIANRLLEVIEDLQTKGFWVIAVVTDNASNEIAAINELDNTAELQQKNILVFRIPCLSHTADLALQAALEIVFPGRDVFMDMTALRKALTKPLRGKTKKIPVSCRTRWLSLGKLVSYFVRNRVLIESWLLEDSRDRAAALRIWERYDFASLSTVFEILDDFIRWTEREDASLATAWDEVLKVLWKLHNRTTSPFAWALHERFLYRMTTTADLRQLILSYLLTLPGLRWYRFLPLVAPYDKPRHVLASQRDVRALVQPLVRHFATIFATDYNIVDRLWDDYLRQTDLRVSSPLFAGSVFWRTVQARGLPVRPGERPCPCFPLADMAVILLHAPVSESSVERVFSILREIFGKRRQGMKEDLVEARLTLMFQDRKDALDFSRSYRQWEMYIDSPEKER
jgi:hypothetical protein